MSAKRSSRSGPASFRSGIRPARLAWLGLVTVPALWLVTASTAANVVVNANPDLAARLWPWNADAQAAKAGTLTTVDASTTQLERARSHAWKALAREPVNIPAVRAVALSEDMLHRPKAAGRLFAYAEGLSRRDLATQLWMIETLVAKGDIDGTLIHYDRALRTRKEAEPLLLPILVSAMATPETRTPIGRLLATRPQWWPRYVEQALVDPATVDTLPFIFARLRVSPIEEQGRGFLSTGIALLIRAGRFSDARAIYRNAMPVAMKEQALLRDGSFERDPLLPPFDWQLAEGDAISALIQTGPGGSRALFAVPTEGAQGEFTRQLLMLPAGRYRLSYRAGSLPADGIRMTLKIQCVAGDTLRDVATHPFMPAPDTGRADMVDFAIPAGGCTAQWLILSVDNPGAVPENLPWLDNMRIEIQSG